MMEPIRTTQVTVSADVIDFGIGQPGLSLLPVDLMQRSADHRLRQADPEILQYGAEQGDGYFRLALAEFLAQGYQIPVSANHLFTTAGASQGLDLICTLFTRPGDVIFAEEPSYFLALRIFADHGLRVIGIPTDRNGLIVDVLEEQLRRHQPAFVYTIPTYQNPTAVTLPLSRRQQLVELSRRHNFLILADEVYQLLNFAEAPPAPLASFLDAETVLSLGSFSKILAPGLRLGWIQTSANLMAPLVGSGLLDSGGGLNPFTSAIVRSALELDLLGNHLHHLKSTYRSRAQALAQALSRDMAGQLRFTAPEGGFFIWCRLPDDIDAARLLPMARELDVSFQPGVKFSSDDGLHNYVRLSFAYYESSALERGVARLKRALQRFSASR